MKTVAIVGASNNRTKFGNKAVRAFLRQGYTVFPVNPRETEVEGLPAFRTVRDVPVRPDRISVYLPPPLVLQVLPEIAARGCDELWLNPGTESEEVLAQAQQLGWKGFKAGGFLAVAVSQTKPRGHSSPSTQEGGISFSYGRGSGRRARERALVTWLVV